MDKEDTENIIWRLSSNYVSHNWISIQIDHKKVVHLLVESWRIENYRNLFIKYPSSRISSSLSSSTSTSIDLQTMSASTNTSISRVSPTSAPKINKHQIVIPFFYETNKKENENNKTREKHWSQNNIINKSLTATLNLPGDLSHHVHADILSGFLNHYQRQTHFPSKTQNANE